MLAGCPRECDRELANLAVTPGDRGRDRTLCGSVLIPENDTADPVGNRMPYSRRADCVEWVHRRNEPETRDCLHHAEPVEQPIEFLAVFLVGRVEVLGLGGKFERIVAPQTVLQEDGLERI